MGASGAHASCIGDTIAGTLSFGPNGAFAPGLTSSFANGVVSVNRTGTEIGSATRTAVFDVANANAVPEPASLALLGLGAAGVLAARRRRAA